MARLSAKRSFHDAPTSHRSAAVLGGKRPCSGGRRTGSGTASGAGHLLFHRETAIGISADEIPITSDLRCANLTIFGAIDGFDADLFAQGKYNVIVTLEGPKDNATMRKKQRVFVATGLTKNRRRQALSPAVLWRYSWSPLLHGRSCGRPCSRKISDRHCVWHKPGSLDIFRFRRSGRCHRSMLPSFFELIEKGMP
ncbi:hypothetical protein ABIE78_003425 [Sinorhizobium fredii]